MVTEPSARPSSTGPTASVLLVFKAILWFSVSQWDVNRMRIAVPEKDVTMPHKNVIPCATQDHVLLGPAAGQRITGNLVLAILLFKGMGTLSARDVSFFAPCRHSDLMLDCLFLNFLAYQPEIPECRVDRDCPGKMSCIDEHCENLCATRNPCQGDLQCTVTEDYDGTRVVACSCPAGFVAVSQSRCEQGSWFLGWF